MLDTKKMNIESLIRFSLESLKVMHLKSELFCYEVREYKNNIFGESLRYSIITLIGLLKAQSCGYSVEIDLEKTVNSVLEIMNIHAARPGDLGLYLWLASLVGAKQRKKVLHVLISNINTTGGLKRLEGQELAWIILGLAHATNDSKIKDIEVLLIKAVDQLVKANFSDNGLFYHYGQNILRQKYPNFATQIYSIYALAKVYCMGLNKNVIDVAKKAADVLFSFQLPDFGWPWIYDVEKNRVVEPYELYSVHQDAMAPMALFELYDATGDSQYKDSAVNSLTWIYGNNQLNSKMIDKTNGIIYRSIRRKKPFDKISLYGNSLSSKILSRYLFKANSKFVEINKTCRPYHFGWLLQAWSGRENI